MAKQTPKASENATGIVTSDAAGRRHWPTWNWRRAAIGAGVLVILAGGVVAWQLHSGGKAPAASTTNEKTRTADRPADYQDLSATGNFSGAQKQLDGQLQNAQTATDKGRIYEEKSQVDFNAGNFSAALSEAQQAEKLHATQNSAYMIASSAEAAGNKSVAASYYQKALERLTDEQKKHAPDIVDMYNQKIKELSS